MAALLDILAVGLIDNSGDVLSSGTVDVYKKGTTTPADVYQDSDLTTPHANPLTLDTVGRAEAYVDEPVRLVIKDSDGDTIYDIDEVGSSTDIAPDSAVLADQLCPKGSIIPFYDFNGALTFSATYWALCNGGSATIDGVVRTLPDTSNRYLVGFGASVDEIQTLTCNYKPTGGTFTVTYGGQTSAAINWNDTDAQVTAKLEAMSSIGTGNILATFDGNVLYRLRFCGTLGDQNLAEVTCSSSLTYAGGAVTLTPSTTRAGVAGGDIGSASWSVSPIGFNDSELMPLMSHTHIPGTLQFKVGESTASGEGVLRFYAANGSSIDYDLEVCLEGTSGNAMQFENQNLDAANTFYTKDGTGVTGVGSRVFSMLDLRPRSIRVRFIMRIA